MSICELFKSRVRPFLMQWRQQTYFYYVHLHLAGKFPKFKILLTKT